MFCYTVSLVTWLGFSAVADSLVEAGCYDYGQRKGSQLSLNADDAGWPIPADGTVERCVGGSDWSEYTTNPSGAPYPYSAETSFELPVSSDLLYFLTRGGSNVGAVNIVTSDVVKDSADVLVHVDYQTQEGLDHANLCLLKKEEENGNGAGIFTPDDWVATPQERMHFDVTVTFPATSGSEPLEVKNFQSNSSHYLYTIGDTQDSVFFDAFTILADSAGITSDSIFAGDGIFSATKAAIKGAFNVTNSLELTTTNAGITAQVGLRNDAPSLLTGVPFKTRYGSAHHSICFDDATGGNFKVSATTIKAPVTLTFTNSPVDSIQTFVASTNNAPITVTMNSAYEGAFTLDSSSAPVSASKSGATDPSGQGRTRAVDQTPGGMGHTKGSTYWQPNSGPGVSQGSVQLTTTRAPIKLTV